MAMAMTTAVVSPPTVSASGGTNSKKFTLHYEKLKSFSNGYNSQLLVCKKSMHSKSRRNLSVRAEYSEGSKGGGGNFVAGFLLGGAVFGTLAYIFAPQIRRSLLNEDEYGFQKPKRPMYYDEGLEKTRQTLNAKISQLNSAIDNVSSRLRGENNAATDPSEVDSEIEAAM